MNKLLLLPSLLVLAAPLASQQQVLSPNQPNGPALDSMQSNGGGSNRFTVTEDFETLSVPGGTFINVGNTLDSTTLVNGQSDLVAEGCVYTSGTAFLWGGAGWESQLSQIIVSGAGASGNWITINYDAPVSSVDMTLSALSTLADTATITVFDSNGILINFLGPIQLPNQNGVPVSFTGYDIKTVTITGSAWGWSPCLDNHSFDVPEFTLSSTGTPGGAMTFDVVNATPSGPVVFLYSYGTGSKAGPNPYTGNVVTTGLANFNFTVADIVNADGFGSASFSHPNVPAAATGLVYMQALDGLSDKLTNVMGL